MKMMLNTGDQAETGGFFEQALNAADLEDGNNSNHENYVPNNENDVDLWDQCENLGTATGRSSQREAKWS